MNLLVIPKITECSKNQIEISIEKKQKYFNEKNFNNRKNRQNWKTF